MRSAPQQCSITQAYILKCIVQFINCSFILENLLINFIVNGVFGNYNPGTTETNGVSGSFIHSFILRTSARVSPVVLCQKCLHLTRNLRYIEVWIHVLSAAQALLRPKRFFTRFISFVLSWDTLTNDSIF